MARFSPLQKTLIHGAMGALCASLLATTACSPADNDPNGGSNKGGGNAIDPIGGGNGATDPGGIVIGDDPANPVAPGNNQETCVTDDAGVETCYCLRVAVIGTADSAADDANATAFRDWLNTKSNALVTVLDPRDPVAPQPKPTLTAEFLANYDVIILQLQGESKDGPFWTYTPEEIAALKTWVEAGGGIISLTGYNGNRMAEETAADNQLLSGVAGMSYGAQDIMTGQTPNAYCWGGSEVVDNFVPESALGYELSAVGAFHGYPVVGGEPAAYDVAGNVVAATAQVGAGFVLAWADEWVLFTNQWYAANPDDAQFTDPNNPCFDKRPEQVFQLPQFWYNALTYAGGARTCFEIDEPTITIK